MTAAPEAPLLTADLDLVRASLAYQYQSVPGLLSICSDADRWAGRRFPTDPAGIEAATAYVAQLDQRGAKGIYAQVTTLRDHPERGRGGKDLAHGLTFLWADGDFGNLGHKPGPDDMPHPIDAAHVREIVTASGLPEPSGWVYSGGGVNPVWMLDQPHIITDSDRDAVEGMTAAVQAILGASAYAHGCAWDTQVGNLDRLMRVPGTINRKTSPDRPTGSEPGTGQPIGLAELRAAVERLEPDARRTLEKAAAEKRDRQAARLGRPAQPAAPSRRPAGPWTGSQGPGVFDLLARHLTFRDVLEPAGWTYRGTAADGREKWLRPAGDGGGSDSEYSLMCDDHVAVNWSERSGLPVGQQAPGHKLTVPTLWAHLHYGGDEREAARDVLRAAHGQPSGPGARALPTAALADVQRHCRPPKSDRQPTERAEPPADDTWAGQPPADPEEPDGEDDPQPDGRRAGLLPEEFYDARPVLQHIRRAAHAEGSSADVLFYSLLARLSAMIPPHYRAVTGIGGRASLNTFVAIVGPSGTGKSIGTKQARALVPPVDPEFLDGLPIGSGEGMAEAFMGTVEEETGEIHARGPNKGDPVTRRVRKQVRHNAFFYVDEGQTLAKLAERSGSVLGETLRRAAIGETLGQTNASEERTRYVAAGSYSLGLAAGFQPATAMPVLADASTGTPQRFLWCWSADPSIPDVPPDPPGPLPLNLAQLRATDTIDIRFPEHIRRTLWAEHVARNRGEIEVSELDGHANLMKVKLAALFALLDGGRTTVTEQDWELAEVVWRSSCAVRDALIRRAQREAQAAKNRETQERVDLELRAHQAKTDRDSALERVALLARRHASQVGGITLGEFRRRLRSTDRDMAIKAVDLAESRDWIFTEGDRICVQTE
ncbi:hypothetical protein FH609_011615 [Streptomyces sp. 3MP-14]|uniref:DUF3987 domain-containing protein n=1 Tax=Streptomyces mimosae TaxID=2586635 RepID=A0A5N6AE01_9ACTN|nr:MULTISPECIES: DUF3987 domain-containing protein [Streptomyces]KAB8167044.1 hypothetical protein FH607_009065 [Streptomyces mimosae]KAB8176985.1 hypothetical protein FH609_011615 [Streptomyces sp. 3MP-14]